MGRHLDIRVERPLIVFFDEGDNLQIDRRAFEVASNLATGSQHDRTPVRDAVIAGWRRGGFRRQLTL